MAICETPERQALLMEALNETDGLEVAVLVNFCMMLALLPPSVT